VTPVQKPFNLINSKLIFILEIAPRRISSIVQEKMMTDKTTTSACPSKLNVI
jgi:hypothetical protein